jgi:hypothetical protein
MLIFLVILVFDPLALLLTLSGTIAILSNRTNGRTIMDKHTLGTEDMTPNKLKRWKSLDNRIHDDIAENRRGV